MARKVRYEEMLPHEVVAARTEAPSPTSPLEASNGTASTTAWAWTR